MSALVIYDSNFGNTKTLAEAIAAQLGRGTRVLSVSDFHPSDLKNVKLLLVGSPINGWQPTEKIRSFLSLLTPGQLQGVSAAAFDTRVKIFFHGDAAGKIAKELRRAGAKLLSPPQAFFVTGTKGPLASDALSLAAAWSKSLLDTR